MRRRPLAEMPWVREIRPSPNEPWSSETNTPEQESSTRRRGPLRSPERREMIGSTRVAEVATSGTSPDIRYRQPLTSGIARANEAPTEIDDDVTTFRVRPIKRAS